MSYDFLSKRNKHFNVFKITFYSVNLIVTKRFKEIIIYVELFLVLQYVHGSFILPPIWLILYSTPENL